MQHHNRDRDVNVWNCRNRRDHRRHKLERLTLRPHGKSILAICKLRLDRHRLTVTTNSQRDHPSRRNLADHAAQLLHAFDLSSVESQNNVVLSDPGLTSRSVLIYQRNFYAMLFLELESAQTISSDIARIYAEVRTSAQIFA